MNKQVTGFTCLKRKSRSSVDHHNSKVDDCGIKRNVKYYQENTVDMYDNVRDNALTLA